jgi:hypothetical protein
MSRSTYKTLYEGYAAPPSKPLFDLPKLPGAPATAPSKPLFDLPKLPSAPATTPSKSPLKLPGAPATAPTPTATAKSAATTPTKSPTATAKSAATTPTKSPTATAKSAATTPTIPPMPTTAAEAAKFAELKAKYAPTPTATAKSAVPAPTAVQPPLMVKSISVPGFLNMIKWDKCLTTEGVQIAYMPNNFEFDVSKFISENGLESYIKVSVSPDKKELKFVKLCNPKF